MSEKRCESCWITCGKGYLEANRYLYRGRKLCSFCVTLWKGKPPQAFDAFYK